VDASHQFCEPHYATSMYLAEAWNAVSSLIMIVLAWHAHRTIVHSKMTNSDRVWMVTSCLWLAIIGTGSFLFHGTMRRSMQLLDEGPMVGFVATSILWKADKHPWTRQFDTLLYRVVLGGLHVAVFWAYLWMGSYELFVHGFTLLVLGDVILNHTWTLGKPLKYRNISLLSILLGRALWEVENRMCEAFPAVWPLHVVWHLLSGVSAYCSVLHNISMVEKPKVQ
jgi:hypothetical protein